VELDKILTKIHHFKGKHEDTEIQKAIAGYKAKTMDMDFHSNYIMHTADMIQRFNELPPKVVRWLVDEEIRTTAEGSAMQKKSIADFEIRRLDMKYYALLDKGIKKKPFKKKTIKDLDI